MLRGLPPLKSMLRTSSYSTSALPYGWLGQLFQSPIKAAVQQANQISSLIDFAAPVRFSSSNLMQYVASIESAPPVMTVFRLSDSQNGSSYLRFVSPYAPLFDAAI